MSFCGSQHLRKGRSDVKSDMKRILLATLILITMFGVARAQHGTAPNGYYPMGYHGDIWTGEVTAVNAANREITLTYVKGEKRESFVGVLPEGYKVKLKDGSDHELKVSEIPIGARVTVYYLAKSRKVEGKKTNFYEIFRLTTAPRASK